MTSEVALQMVSGLGLSLRLEAGELIVEGSRALTEGEAEWVRDNWAVLARMACPELDSDASGRAETETLPQVEQSTPQHATDPAAEETPADDPQAHAAVNVPAMPACTDSSSLEYAGTAPHRERGRHWFVTADGVEVDAFGQRWPKAGSVDPGAVWSAMSMLERVAWIESDAWAAARAQVASHQVAHQTRAPASASELGPYPAAASDTRRGNLTLWAQLGSDERSEWMAESPAHATASRDGHEPAPVSFGRADLRQRADPGVHQLPAGLRELDHEALAFWSRLSLAERERSTMKPTHALARMARLEGRSS